MLKRTTRSVKKAVSILTEPEAQFVSLVGHAANQTPFKVLKAEKVRQLKTETDMSNDNNGTLIHKFEFDKEQFGDEETVRKHMDSHGYEGYAVEDTDKVFVVKGVDESAFETIESIPDTTEGLTMYVGVPKDSVAKRATATPEKEEVEKSEEESSDSKEEVEKSEEGSEDSTEGEEGKGEEAPEGEESEGSEEEKEEVEKSEEKDSVLKSEDFDSKEVIKKYDSWHSDYYGSNNDTLAAELAGGNDGVPLGYWEAQSALRQVIYTLTTSGETEKIPAACAEFGVLVQKLAELSQGSETVMKAAFDKPEEKETTTKSESEAPEVTEELIQSVVKGLISPVVEELESVKEDLSERVTKGESRLASLETLKVVRKSANSDPEPTPKKEEVAKSESASGYDNLKSLLGFQR